MDALIGWVLNYVNEHPNVMSILLIFIVVHTAVKAFFDSLVSSRAEWDKTPLTDDTWYEKTLTWGVRILGFTGKIVAYLAGFRPKSKVEIKTEAPK